MKGPLTLPTGYLGPGGVLRRRQAIAEAVAWPAGPSTEQPVFTTVADVDGYQVCLGKPGKEAAPEYARPNPNDMLPSVVRDGKRHQYTPDFTQIFEEFQQLGIAAGDRALELVGALVFRGAFMLDHREIAPGCWRYDPPAEVLAEVRALAPEVAELPIAVFLHHVDALAWNEDVKFDTLGYDIARGFGRHNTLLTCAHIIAVFLGRASIVRFAGSLTRVPVGVAPITQKAAKDFFQALVD